MDKSWISKDRDSLEFEIVVEEFLIFAEENCKDPKRIPCPCGRCVNFKKFSTKIIRGHIYDHGFSLGYVDWIWHEEKSTRSTRPSIETVEVCEAAFNLGNYDKDSYDFQRFVVDAEQPLFEGSECTKLQSMLKLHNWKARFGISDTAFTELLSSVGSILPKDNVLPPNAYEAKKTLSDLGLEYIKIHSCPNDCILYRGIHSDASQCPHCKLSRWKVRKNGQLRVNVPTKVMWYFPIIPRFKRLFKSPSTAELMTWHANQRINDDKMRHPADSPSWRNIDYRWPAFGSESRNIRLALSADVLVPGPHEPGNNIDVYLQPLIDDLKKLLEEAYGNLSGCVNKGYKSCPICGDDTVAKYLSHSRKMCFQGYRRYLPRQHPYRRYKAAFNEQQELGNACQPLSGVEVLARQERIDFCFGKEVKKSKKVECPWKKKSVFFELEYWKYHHVRHCLDVMHIEKNVCDNLLGTLLNMRKSKDSEAARRDMIDMGVRHDLAPQVGEKKTYLPPSPFTLSKAEKKKVLNSFLSMKLPSGHGSNIKNCVSMSDLKIYGLKSHDCHILLQQLLPVAIRSVLPKNVRVTIIRLCFFFNALCSKVVDVSKLDKLQSDKCVYVDRMHKEYLDEIYRGKKKSVHWLMGEHNRLFADWFEKKVSSEMKGNPDAVSETIR
ncbi:uncharacterized protein LOC141680825 [Apium graveolens]|uniref:uncharacterized protein LOC141680825 n=1 Tax=Apium graveolens TaxID=4045 RepID=UPI003D7AD149